MVYCELLRGGPSCSLSPASLSASSGVNCEAGPELDGDGATPVDGGCHTERVRPAASTRGRSGTARGRNVRARVANATALIHQPAASQTAFRATLAPAVNDICAAVNVATPSGT
eukprot:scaffold12924_cov125-Isochrysis_galbana.AAC.14